MTSKWPCAVIGKLAERLAQQKDAPRDLIVTLANDQIEVAHARILVYSEVLEVAHPLVYSEVLLDSELIEIIAHRTLEHQLAIAMRRTVSEAVSDALVETGNETVVVRLLENENAHISDATMAFLVEQSKRFDSYQNPLVNCATLSPDLAKRMYWWVSAALRKHILEHFEIDPSDLDDEIEHSVTDILAASAPSADSPISASLHLVDTIDASIKPELLIQLLRQGEISLFETLFGRLLDLRPTMIRRLIYEPGGEGLATACRAVGFDKPVFSSIFILSRQSRPCDEEVGEGELSQVLELYDRVDNETASSLLDHWRRSPKYLELQRQLEFHVAERAVGSLPA